MLASLFIDLVLVPAAPLTAATNLDQIETQAGKVQTLVLKSGDELRPDALPDQASPSEMANPSLPSR